MRKHNKNLLFAFVAGPIFIASLLPISYYSKSQMQISDPAFVIEEVVSGLDSPSQIAFVDEEQFLVLENTKGTVKKVVNGTALSEPVLDVNVSTAVDRGMLGITVSGHEDGSNYVFLYYTESPTTDGEDESRGIEPLGNRLYRYRYVDDKLINGTLLLDLPAKPSGLHNGGALLIGPDNNLYLTTGDLGYRQTEAQNVKNLNAADGSSGILRLTQNGEPVADPDIGEYILGDDYPLNLYYAYGIRNSYGISFDPVTGLLWDTENGPSFGDEINLVEAGFNSGWREVQGIWKRSPGLDWESAGNRADNLFAQEDLDRLLTFDGKGRYSSPELTWNHTVAPTGLVFFNSTTMGNKYFNDLFVGDVVTGTIYHFDLNSARTSLNLQGVLADGVANNGSELEDVIFASGIGEFKARNPGVTDLKLGPDGHLYVVSIGAGKVFRIVPNVF